MSFCLFSIFTKFYWIRRKLATLLSTTVGKNLLFLLFFFAIFVHSFLALFVVTVFWRLVAGKFFHGALVPVPTIQVLFTHHLKSVFQSKTSFLTIFFPLSFWFNWRLNFVLLAELLLCLGVSVSFFQIKPLYVGTAKLVFGVAFVLWTGVLSLWRGTFVSYRYPIICFSFLWNALAGWTSRFVHYLGRIYLDVYVGPFWFFYVVWA